MNYPYLEFNPELFTRNAIKSIKRKSAMPTTHKNYDLNNDLKVIPTSNKNTSGNVFHDFLIFWCPFYGTYKQRLESKEHKLQDKIYKLNKQVSRLDAKVVGIQAELDHLEECSKRGE